LTTTRRWWRRRSTHHPKPSPWLACRKGDVREAAMVNVAQNRRYRSISSLTREEIGFKIWIRGRIHAIRKFGKVIFVILRQEMETIQCGIFLQQQSDNSEKEVEKNEKIKELIARLKGFREETIVDLLVEICEPVKELTSPSMKIFEFFIVDISPVSIPSPLPFAVHNNEVNLSMRLNYRWIDLRMPANQAIFRIRSGVCQFFRNYFLHLKFIEVHSPNLRMETSSDRSLEIFHLPNGIALSDQLQMEEFSVIQTDLCHGIFEIGTVHQAKCANTHRHLCAFTQMDFLMNDHCKLLQVFRPNRRKRANVSHRFFKISSCFSFKPF
jgi:aspartyl-tRNA synthetase